MAKIYVKRGAPNARESKMVQQIQRAIDAEKAKNPDYVFDKSCKTFEELRELHKQMCTEEIPFEEVKEPTLDFGKSTESKIKDLNKVEEADAYTDDDNNKNYVDPFNRANPVVRDYVLDDKMSKNGGDEIKTGSAYNEPLNFDDAFSLPDEDNEEEEGTTKKGGKKSTADKKPKKPRSRKEAPEPINPDFSNMTATKQNKNTKIFAKYIVEAVCTLAERGFVWYATSDINEAKLVEYEVSGEMDLSVLLTMEDGQQVAVKQWFLGQNILANELALISQDDRDELADALAEVLKEKGFAPSPTQILLMKAGSIFLLQKGLSLLNLKMQTNSVLTQLRAMANPTKEQEFIPEKEVPIHEPVQPQEYVREEGEPETKLEEENDGTQSTEGTTTEAE